MSCHTTVVAGLVPAIHDLEGVDARHKAGQDEFVCRSAQ
jgi:hypothetical protein